MVLRRLLVRGEQAGQAAAAGWWPPVRLQGAARRADVLDLHGVLQVRLPGALRHVPRRAQGDVLKAHARRADAPVRHIGGRHLCGQRGSHRPAVSAADCSNRLQVKIKYLKYLKPKPLRVS